MNIHSLPRQLFVFLMVAILAGCASFSPDELGEKHEALQPQSFKFKDRGEALYYSFAIGNPSADSPLIFFVSGSGCTSVNKRFPGYFDPVSHLLEARVLVLQKRGIEEHSRGQSCSRNFALTDHFDQTVADQKEFIDWQLAQQSTPPKAVVLMGASEGAVVASKLASTDARVTHLALVGSGGSTVRHNLQTLSQRVWYLHAYEETLAEIASDPESTTRNAWNHSHKYWSSLLDVNIGDLLLSLDIPIVIAMGELDDSVPVETAYDLEQRFKAQGKTNLHLYTFPDSDHRLYDRKRSRSHVSEFLKGLVTQLQKGSAE